MTYSSDGRLGECVTGMMVTSDERLEVHVTGRMVTGDEQLEAPVTGVHLPVTSRAPVSLVRRY